MDLESVSKSLAVKSDNLSAGAGFVDYTMIIVIYYTAYEKYPGNQTSKIFKIRVTDYCVPIALDMNSSFEPQALSYTIFEQAELSQFESSWTTEPVVCNLHYVYTLLPVPV